jgi:hypothetical protein
MREKDFKEWDLCSCTGPLDNFQGAHNEDEGGWEDPVKGN